MRGESPRLPDRIELLVSRGLMEVGMCEISRLHVLR
jgi:hypothetical protein